jgi:nucleoside 2-deoxyribosyltransferase
MARSRLAQARQRENKSMARKKVYLAGPDVFLPDAVAVGHKKKQLCDEYGFEGLYSLDKDGETQGDPAQIFRANCALMQQADIGLFNLTPFRGPSTDVGTAFEVAFLFAAGKPLYGYTSTTADYLDRVTQAFGPPRHSDGRYLDSSGCSIENCNLYDNLMISRAIADSGGSIVRIDESDTDRVSLAAWKAFQACLELARSQV